MTGPGRGSFLRFITVGAINTAVGLATIAAAHYVFHADPYVANTLGFAVGIGIGYALNRRWTFSSSQSVLITAPRYLLVFAIAYAINVGVLAAALRVPGMPLMAAQAAAIATYSLAFYGLCRWVVFTDRR